MKSSVLTTQSQTKASGNAAHSAARTLCASPLPFLVVLFDLTRIGEVGEFAVAWIALAVAAAAGVAKSVGITSATLKPVISRVSLIAAGMIVNELARKGYLSPETQNAVTGQLAEIFAGLALIVLGGGVVHADAKRELKTVAKLGVEKLRTRVALQLPAGATREELQAAIDEYLQGEQKGGERGPNQ